jgi:hypothetical protein
MRFTVLPEPSWKNSADRKARGSKVRGILADINVKGQQRTIQSIWNSNVWREIWLGLGLMWESFPSLGLSVEASDALIWRTCQREKLVLITSNRNADGPESLESVIRSENKVDSLPVITIANADRVMQDRVYAEQVAERLLGELMRIDDIRGTGRIYVP